MKIFTCYFLFLRGKYMMNKLIFLTSRIFLSFNYFNFFYLGKVVYNQWYFSILRLEKFSKEKNFLLWEITCKKFHVQRAVQRELLSLGGVPLGALYLLTWVLHTGTNARRICHDCSGRVRQSTLSAWTRKRGIILQLTRITRKSLWITTCESAILVESPNPP